MEIKIDTKKDSAEDIKKAIELLKRIVESDTGYEGSGLDGNNQDVASGMSSMFGDTPVLGSSDDDESIGSEDKTDSDEEPDENAQIMTY